MKAENLKTNRKGLAAHYKKSNDALLEKLKNMKAELGSVRARLGAATKKIKHLNVVLHETAHSYDVSQEESMKLKSCEYRPELPGLKATWIQEPFMKIHDDEKIKPATMYDLVDPTLQQQLDKNNYLIEQLENQVKNLIQERNNYMNNAESWRIENEELRKKMSAVEAANGHLIAALHRIDIANNI